MIGTLSDYAGDFTKPCIIFMIDDLQKVGECCVFFCLFFYDGIHHKMLSTKYLDVRCLIKQFEFAPGV